MSGLPFNTGLCQGWVPPGTNYAVPTITYMSGTYSPAGATTLIAIFGTNFKLYSTIKFGTFTPTMIFISSQQIDFYVPTTAPGGGSIYPVQVFNDTYGSNVVNYTLDSAPGFWKLSNIYDGVIENTNYGGLFVTGELTINNSEDSSTGTAITGNIVFNNNAIGGINYSQSITWINTSPTCSITGINDTLIISTNLYVNGIITATGDMNAPNFNQTSDYRIKDIIEPLDSDLYSVDNLKPVKYFNKKSGKEDIGFIAHEVQESFPCLVTGEKDGKDLQTLNYIGLIGILTKEIQRLKADVEELKKAR
jgi:hypothetical protein